MATILLQQHGGVDNALSDSFFRAWRPWMALYGVRLRLKGTNVSEIKLAPVQVLLPEELLLLVFSKLTVTGLGAAQCVCRQWRAVGNSQGLWQQACLEVFHNSNFEQNCKLVKSQFRSCWKTMFLDRPHLRFDGIYVSRNTYLRTGVVEWKVKNPVHLVCYFRYYRFMPDGTFLYRTTPEVISKVAKSLLHIPKAQKQQQDHIYHGRFKLEGSKILTAMQYDSSFTTEIRSRLSLRSTSRGANNRLDIDKIVSYDLTDGMVMPMAATGNEDADELEGVEQRTHKRGLAPFVFVPWDQVNSSALNLPVSQMDYFLPG